MVGLASGEKRGGMRRDGWSGGVGMVGLASGEKRGGVKMMCGRV